jgi:hypothetical protein
LKISKYLAKTYIPLKYQALPPWLQIQKKDPFDYKLRTFDEVTQEQAESPPDFPIKLIYINYPKAEQEVADRSRKV